MSVQQRAMTRDRQDYEETCRFLVPAERNQTENDSMISCQTEFSLGWMVFGQRKGQRRRRSRCRIEKNKDGVLVTGRVSEMVPLALDDANRFRLSPLRFPLKWNTQTWNSRLSTNHL